MNECPGRHLVIVGPTASGKSAVALELATRLNSEAGPFEIVSADSMQVYRGMDIGTAKPSVDEQAQTRHHLIDVVEPCDEYSVAEFVGGANAAIDDIESRGGRAIVVGGTGLYIQALVDRLKIPGQFPDVLQELEQEQATDVLFERLKELDPQAASRTEPGNRRRILRALEVTIGSGRPFSEFGPGLDSYPPTSFALAGIRLDRELLTERIASRFNQQMSDGFLAEVEKLISSPAGISRTAGQALGYKELIRHLHHGSDLDETVGEAILRTRQFAVRQVRWFRRDPRIMWFDHSGDPLEVLDDIETFWWGS